MLEWEGKQIRAGFEKSIFWFKINLNLCGPILFHKIERSIIFFIFVPLWTEQWRETGKQLGEEKQQHGTTGGNGTWVATRHTAYMLKAVACVLNAHEIELLMHAFSRDACSFKPVSLLWPAFASSTLGKFLMFIINKIGSPNRDLVNRKQINSGHQWWYPALKKYNQTP